jgi:hypothetical protein
MEGEVITLERLREVLEYNPESGVWVWRACTGSGGVGGWKAKPGKIAGSLDNNGYVVICIDRAIYKAHRLAWLYMTGSWPRSTIDHINLEPADNRWVNLREATYSQNNANRKLVSLNKSGLKGVSWDKRAGRWRAQSSAGGRSVYLGLYDTKEEASAAYRAWAKETFGEFYYEQ